MLTPFDSIFDQKWLMTRPILRYPLSENLPYKEEVNKWLGFFQSKGWLTNKVVKRLRNVNNFESFHSKINEFRCGYFFEKKLYLNLSGYEVPTINNKDVEFEGSIGENKILIDVKTPMDFPLNLMYQGGFNNSDKVIEVISKSVGKLPNNFPSIIVLSDGLNVSLFRDLMAQNTIWKLLENDGYKKVSAVLILGNVYHNDMYKMGWAVNSNAYCLIDEKIFDGYQNIHKL